MNYALRNIVSLILIAFIFIFGYYFLFSRQKGQYIPSSWADFDCMHPYSIASDELQPKLLRGTILILNQCIREKQILQTGDIVLFEQDRRTIIGYIKEIEERENKTYYIITTHNDGTAEYTILSTDVIAFTTLPSES